MNEVFRTALFLPPQASSVARGIDWLHYTVIGTAFAVAFLAFFAIVVFLIRFRERPGEEATRRHVPRRLELAAAAFTLTVFLVWWAIGFGQYRELRTPPDGAMRIHIVAKQWMWQFVYPNGAISEDALYVPVGEPVEVLLTSRDVIHSFYVPAFRLKQDVVPGRVTSLWFTAVEPGTYQILCAEYCGAGHSRMRGRVVAMQPSDYARWAQDRVGTAIASTGEHLAATYGCFRCHTVDGTPHLGPTFRGLYGSEVVMTNGQRVRADDEYLTKSMMDPNLQIVAGYKPLMPSYLGQLSGADAAAILEYIRSLRGPR